MLQNPRSRYVEKRAEKLLDFRRHLSCPRRVSLFQTMRMRCGVTYKPIVHNAHVDEWSALFTIRIPQLLRATFARLSKA